MNGYTYASNNPLRLVDPNGQWFWDVITGRQSWNSFAVEVGTAANYLYDNSGAWRTAMDHPVATGVIVGVGGGAAAYAGAAGLTYLSTTYLGGIGTACLVNCNSVIQKAPEYAQRGYNTFEAFKNAVGSADPTGQNLRQWHHIVEQTPVNRENFGPEALQSGQNIVNIPTAIHQQISAYYSSIKEFTNGLTVRNWLSTQSFSQQAEFGRKVLEKAVNNNLR